MKNASSAAQNFQALTRVILMKFKLFLAAAALLIPSISPAQNSLVPEADSSAVSLKVYPSSLALSDSTDRQRIIVLAERADGSTYDVTSAADVKVSVPGIVELESATARPLADGACEIIVHFQNQEIKVPVTVSGTATVPSLSFRTDVLATLTKAGCNTGKCHGSASGKDGFRLSLFGFDPTGDHSGPKSKSGFS